MNISFRKALRPGMRAGFRVAQRPGMRGCFRVAHKPGMRGCFQVALRPRTVKGRSAAFGALDRPRPEVLSYSQEVLKAPLRLKSRRVF